MSKALKIWEKIELKHSQTTDLLEEFYWQTGKEATAEEQDRILKLIWEVQIQVTVDKNTTQRDLDAMDYALWQYKNKLQTAIKEESK